jgi:hypothetical protein
MDQLRDNIEALASDADGAPVIVSDALEDYPWGYEDIRVGSLIRNRLSASTNSTSGSLSASGTVDITLPPYCFYVAVGTTGGIGGPIYIAAGTGTPNVDAPKIKLVNASADNSVNYQVKWRYLNA